MNHFWKWVVPVSTIHNKADPDATVVSGDDQDKSKERTLLLNGTIAEESWFDDDVTPKAFKDELDAGNGDITVWINSPGGDCFAAASIYNMLMDYKGKVTVKIDGLAASAASVIAMAGDKVIVSPVSMIMIHNPMTMAAGDKGDMQKAIEMLESVKDSIINAYANKTGLSRNKLSRLMDDETWMDANKAVELGFADEIMKRPDADEEQNDLAVPVAGNLYSSRQMADTFINKVKDKMPAIEEKKPEAQSKYNVKALEQRLLFMRPFIGLNEEVPNGTGGKR